MNILKRCVCLLLFLFPAACSTMQKPLPDYTPGAIMETFSSSVSLSIHTLDQNMAGNGYMVYRRPDKVHMVVLSPFGTTIMDAFAVGDLITFVYPSQGIAYSGRFDELPDKGGLSSWRLMRWVMESDPSCEGKQNGRFDRLNKQGLQEKVTCESGLVTEKSLPNGEKVYYGNYRVASGVPFATEIDMRNAKDDRILLKFEEAEINAPLDDAAFVPRLEGIKVLPLSAVQ